MTKTKIKEPEIPIATEEDLQKLREDQWPPKEAKGTVEDWPWEKQDPVHKDVCCMCRGKHELLKIEGEEKETCHLCGNKVVICRGCIDAFEKNNPVSEDAS